MGIKQNTTLTNESSAGKGKSDTQRIKGAFASSPLYNSTPDQLSEDGTLQSKMREWYSANVLNVGTDHGNPDYSGVSLDYGTAPNLADAADAEAPNTVISPYVPTTASPGEGNEANAKSIPATTPVGGHNGQLGTTDSPQDASTRAGGFDLTKMPDVGKAQ